MFRSAILWSLTGLLALEWFPVSADEDVPQAVEPPQYSTQEVYTTHAPGTYVPGRFQAGPCQGGPESPENKRAEYEPGVDAKGNPVVTADLPNRSAFNWPGPSFQYQVARVPTAKETQHGLVPDDTIVVDSGDGTVIYNDMPLIASDDLPPAPGPCE